MEYIIDWHSLNVQVQYQLHLLLPVLLEGKAVASASSEDEDEDGNGKWFVTWMRKRKEGARKRGVSEYLWKEEHFLVKDEAGSKGRL